MQIIHETPYLVHPLDCAVGPGSSAMSLVVKGTFKMKLDGAAEAVSEPPEMRGDETYMDDLGRSLAYSSDLLPYKPRGEVIVNANCHPPEGRARPECDVAIQVGPIRKALRVTGDRRWSKGSPPVATAPLAFQSMPIRWERAFGSLTSPANPLGRGVDVGTVPGDDGVYLPNVEYPGLRVTSPQDRPTPAGFGAIAQHWEPRLKRSGTRDQRWAAFRAPLPPTDCEARAANAAPDDQQLEDGQYFRGDETLVLENLHRGFARFTSALPGKRLRAFLWMRPTRTEPERFAEIDLKLDTVFIDAEKEELTLVWRRPVQLDAPTEVAIEAIYLTEESTAVAPSPAEVHVARFLELRPKEDPVDQQKEIDEQMAEVHKLLSGPGMDPALAKAAKAEKDPAKVLDLILRGIADKAHEAEQLTAKLKAGQPLV
ncbi:MAG: DUF2169 domain-containing protein [Polyangiaceae bacterium]